MSDAFYDHWDGQIFYPDPNSPISWNWNDFFTALAWSGLQETDEWNSLNPELKTLYSEYAKTLNELEISSFNCN